MNLKYKNSGKNDFAINLLISLIAGMLWFMGAKFFEGKASIVVYALAIAVSYCKISVEAIEKLMNKKFSPMIISTVAILIIFASQKFAAAAGVAVVYSLCKAIYDYICSLFSEKINIDEDNKLKYNVVCGEEMKEVFAEDLMEDDVVSVKYGDYIGFSYVLVNAKDTKAHKAGKFTANKEGFVKVVELVDYEIDFLESSFESTPRCVKFSKIFTLICTILTAVGALSMFALNILRGEEFFEAFYVLGVYLVFANPLVFNSGVILSGLLCLTNFENKGVYLKNVSVIEKLSRVKKIFFKKKVALDSETKAAQGTVKAVKIANVLNIETELLSDADDKDTFVIANACGFKQYDSGCDDEKIKETLAEQVIEGTVAYVCEGDFEQTKNILTVGTEQDSEVTVEKDNLPEFVKAVKTSKLYKWFVVLRSIIGAFINFVVMAFFASGIGDKYLSNKLLDIDMTVAGTDNSTFMSKVANCLLYNDMLAPWIIAFVHLIIINLLLFVTVCFLNDDKKLR